MKRVPMDSGLGIAFMTHDVWFATAPACCARLVWDQALARWKEGAGMAEQGMEDECFNRCPIYSTCNARTKRQVSRYPQGQGRALVGGILL